MAAVTSMVPGIKEWCIRHGAVNCYAFDIHHEVGDVARATFYCYAVNEHGAKYLVGSGETLDAARREPFTVAIECWPENVDAR